MPKSRIEFCCAAFLSLMVLVSQAAAAPKSIDGELLVKFRGGPRGVAAGQAQQTLGYEVHRKFDRVGWQQVRLRPGQSQAQVLARLRQRPDVIAAEPNYVFQLRLAEPVFVPNDPRFNEQWAFGKIDATNAWALTSGSSNVVVAVLDTGVRYNHEDLALNMWRNPGEIPANGIDDDANGYVDDIFGIDAVTPDADPMDQPVGFTWHGTACASIIGAAGNNGRGMTGLNWPVQIMALRLAAASNFISSAWAAECFEYVLMMKERGVNVRVTSNSYGLDDSPSLAVRDAIDAAGNAGVLNVFAAGNARKNVDASPDYPAAFQAPSIINVAATDANDLLATFSNYGATNVDLAAPGVGITVADGSSTNGYSPSFTGTSAACPYVAGAAALIASAYPSATVAQIKTTLMETVDLLPSLTNRMVSHGRLNVGRAIYHPGLASNAPPHVLTSPQSQTVGVGYPATFCVTATGAQAIDYLWLFEGNEIAHTAEPMLTLPDVALTDAGDYHVVLSNAFGLSTSAVATLTVATSPVLLTQPQGLRVLDGTNVVFKAGAAGAFPLMYQWFLDGALVARETNDTIAFINTQGTMSGEYQAVISNGYGSITTEVARLTVLTRPHIVSQPQSQTVAVGANVSLSVTVTNTATLPLGVRWRRGASFSPVTVLNSFSAATNLQNIQTNLSGIWSTLITNEGPSGATAIASSNAYLTVVLPPTNVTVATGANASFNTLAVGPAPIRYQWQRNGTNIPNATNISLVLPDVQPGHAGTYSVIVTNAIGQPTSFAAVLQVIGLPMLTEAARLPDGTFTGMITGLVPNQTYTIESSTNLLNWEPRPPFAAPETSVPFVDISAPATPRRFFRVRSGAP